MHSLKRGGILTKTRNDAESGDESDDDSVMPPLLSEKEIDDMDYEDELDRDIISTEMLEDISDGSQSHLNINQIEARYKTCDSIRQRQSE